MSDTFSKFITSPMPPLPGDLQKAQNWYYSQARNIGNLNPVDILRQPAVRENLRNVVIPGRLYMFLYMPANAATLPYYDRFPLVFPFNITEAGFTGINMHYLPPVYRAILLDGLTPFILESPDETRTRIRLSYDLLSSMARLRYFKPAVKQYLNSHVRSRFLVIPYSEWYMALMLPLERFRKKNTEFVFKESRQMIRKSGKK